MLSIWTKLFINTDNVQFMHILYENKAVGIFQWTFKANELYILISLSWFWRTFSPTKKLNVQTRNNFVPGPKKAGITSILSLKLILLWEPKRTKPRSLEISLTQCLFETKMFPTPFLYYLTVMHLLSSRRIGKSRALTIGHILLANNRCYIMSGFWYNLLVWDIREIS